MTQKATLPEIEKLKFKDFTIDNLYSGRTEKEINENAKDKQKELEVAGGWNPAMPGQYFEKDGEKFLLAGFSRVKASMLNGEDSGYFVRVEGDDIDHLLACETTNSVRPLSMLARGARYVDLRNGVLADDFTGAVADRKNIIATDWKRAPLTVAEIADRIGKNPVWVYKCIAIFEAPPEIRDLIETDKLAASVAESARILADKHHNGSDAKCIAICKRAYAAARADGKETATKKYFEEIKGEFIPEKKLVADGKKDAKDKNTSTEASRSPATASKDEKKDDTADELPAGNSEPEREEPELFPEAAHVLTPGDKKNTKLIAALATFLTDDKAIEKLDITMTLTPDEAEKLAEEIVKIVANAAEVF